MQALRRQRPETQIELLANSAYQALIQRCVDVTAVRALDAPSLAPFFADVTRLPDAWANWFGTFNTVVSYLHDADGIFARNVMRCGARNFIAGPSSVSGATHAARQLAAPLSALGVAIDDYASCLRINAAASQHRIAIHPGSGSAQKNWPLERWIPLAEHLFDFQIPMLVVTGEADQIQYETLRARLTRSDVEFANEFSLENLPQLLANTLFVGHDSGISHLAAAAGARCLLLFGPTDPEIWAPLNQNVRVLRAPNGDLTRLELSVVAEALNQELMRIGIST